MGGMWKNNEHFKKSIKGSLKRSANKFYIEGGGRQRTVVSTILWIKYWTRLSILGSDCMTLIVMHWLLSDCSLPAQLLLVCFLSALWPRRTKIDFFFEVCAAQTDRHTLWLLELLWEPKKIFKKVQKQKWPTLTTICQKWSDYGLEWPKMVKTIPN